MISGVRCARALGGGGARPDESGALPAQARIGDFLRRLTATRANLKNGYGCSYRAESPIPQWRRQRVNGEGALRMLDHVDASYFRATNLWIRPGRTSRPPMVCPM
jgi:hypothetical protein